MTPLRETYGKPEIHDKWESIYRSNPILDTFNDQIMDRLISHINLPCNALFLDAGCGVADHSIRIARRGYRCVGVDISEYILGLARTRIVSYGVEDRVSLVCRALEDLPFPECSFDAVHCRGVLMHIPDWEKSLCNLCRVLKPGGRIAIMESNHASLQTAATVLARRIIRGKRMEDTPGGVEFWSEKDGKPFLVRHANVAYLVDRLEGFQVRTIHRFCTSLLGIHLFPSGYIRNTIIRLNQLCFFGHVSPQVGIGNAIIGEKLG